MPIAEKRVDLDLGARARTLHEVIESTRATDRAGADVPVETAIVRMLGLLTDMRRTHGALYVVGNGGSAAVAAHAVTDFLKIGGLRAITLHDPSLMTCMANDYGYEHAFARMLAELAQPGDVFIGISSSGRSPNICNAADMARSKGAAAITLSGFTPDNSLRSLGDLNVWLDSHDYGMVEIGHQFVLHNLSDRLALDR